MRLANKTGWAVYPPFPTDRNEGGNMKPIIYKGLRLGTNKTEWVSSDEIKQSY